MVVAWLLVLLQLGALERLQAAVTHFDVQASVAEVRVSMGSRRLNRVLISDRIWVLQTFEILYRLIQNGIVRRSDLGDDEGALALLVFVAWRDLEGLVNSGVLIMKVEFLQSFPQMLMLREVLGIFLLVMFVPNRQVSFGFIASLAFWRIPELHLELTLPRELSGVIAHQRLLEGTFGILCLHQGWICGICKRRYIS